MKLLNALSIDVEDYFQVSAFERDVPRAEWEHHESRVAPNTRRILELLDRHNVSATFFVLGWIAERFPDVVREIRDAGHEVGSHSYWHELVYRQSPEQFRDDLRRARDVLQQALGEPITAYRAPSFSITRQSLWALEILAAEGFRSDSSIFPIRHDRYGIHDAPRGIHPMETTAGLLWEFPPSTLKWGPLTMPIAGGGYFRLYPFALTKRCLEQVNRAGQPFMFYLHPWELDPDQPRLAIGSRMTRFRHYVNLASTERKLERLLQEFRLGRMCDVLELHHAEATPIASVGGHGLAS